MPLVAVLQELGMTEYEARSYLALLEKSPLSGYGVARSSGVPRSKIYEVLDSLVKKGAVLTNHGDRVQYAPLPANEFVARCRTEMEAVLKQAEAGLERFPTRASSGGLIWDIRGRQEIIERGRDLIRRAGQGILMEVWAADAKEFRADLAAAAGRGVQVVVVAYGDPAYPFATVYHHDSTDSVTAGLGGRWLVLSMDMAEIVAGIVSLETNNRAAWSAHPGLVVPITELIKHDLYKLEMLNAHRVVLERTFGPSLRELRNRFAAFAAVPRSDSDNGTENFGPASRDVGVTGPPDSGPPVVGVQRPA
jgi:HTH-type transcriptional regulator, sugar sensing transcriptional regulator